MNNKFKSATIVTLTVLAVMASGCQTVQGAGKDIQTVGKKAEEVIRK